MEWTLLLLLLLCPLMMLFMHKGHNHGKHEAGHDHDLLNRNNEDYNHSIVQRTSSGELKNITDYKVKQLEGEIEYLKNQNKTLQGKLENLTKDASH